MKKFISLLSLCIICAGIQLNAQQIKGTQKATLVVTSEQMVEVPSIASQIANGTFQSAENIAKEFNPKKWGKNTSVPGKGFPKGNDPLWDQQIKATKSPGKAPILTFEAASSGSTPTDPTGAVGPNHFVNSWNSSFRIWDKSGNPLTPAASLGTILPGTLGDPIVVYDRYADRFLITEFYSNGFYVGISQGPDPVNDGWFVYTFPTNTFPDYPKFSVWSDGYYITANKDQNTPTISEVVFAIERDKMLTGDLSAQMIGFPLAGIVTSGFYSPLGFNCNGSTLPPVGNAPIVYMQDDAWTGVSTDHLKIWNINVNWTTPASSTISSPQIINTTPFDGLFDGGSFSNLPQPSGGDIDALQATIMYMAQYRRFPGYNSVIFNFVVDLDGGDDYSGIRWYELRQNYDGDPWTIYQEGTYSQPSGHSAFSGNMCMDASGNIGLAYTCVSTTLFPSLRYTGRYASDPLGTMTLTEEVILNGTQSDPSTRYGDYAQMTIDPIDDATFWSIGEVFNGSTRKNHVGVFQISPPVLTAEFSATQTSVCNGSSVSFMDQSLGSPSSWNWTFTGGSPSSFSGQNPPPVTYSSPGSYTVSLTVGDGVDTDIETKTNYIVVQNVIADFSASPTSVVVGNTVTFTDNSSCIPTSWSWSFPGGNPSTFIGQNPPAVQYDTEGTFDVSLSVSNTLGSDLITKTGFISVLPPEFNMSDGIITTCMGNFYDPGGPTLNYSNNEDYVMTFYASTPGAQLEFNFSSFDVEFQSSCNYDYLNIYNGENTSAPLIGQYCGTNSPGIVTSSNAYGAITFDWHSDVSVTESGWSANITCLSLTDPPVADFAASNITPSINSDVSFTDLSGNVPTSWSWSFNPTTFVYVNGTSANSQNPVVQFTNTGSYSVGLTSTNGYGADTETKINYIEAVEVAYCIPSYSSGTSVGDYISLVQLGDINNSTGASSSPYYTYYSSLSTDLTQEDSYTITLSAGTYGSGNYLAVWMDYNRDGMFNETTEKLGTILVGPTPATGTINFTVPTDANIGATRMRVREVWNNTNFDACSQYSYGETEDYNINVLSKDLRLDIAVKLEGPYNPTTNLMETTLNSMGYLPTLQPYNPPTPYYGNPNPIWQYLGTESVISIPVNVVDWVVVQLRDASSPGNASSATILDTQAGLLLSNGTIVSTDGVSPLLFDVTFTQGLFVVIYHRNHLGIISNVALTEVGGVYSYDFSTGENQAYGGLAAHKQLEPGVWGMVAADGDANGTIQLGDKNGAWLTDFGISGYLGGDFDMNSVGQLTDKNVKWLNNLGTGGQIPAKGVEVNSGYKSQVPK